ncbi:soluble N-ethylmaleimide sensitive factor (NSF) attachment protein, putative [Trypanosoma equiperdum]|uniref:Soluble N-ethylmaleimide sensitive factor (NSF) attachment protein, putative n=4 Tax=Trypanozoon TaxID=39700 RepID=Q4GYR2_TRYB2|nr:soluble N-ethylmaleimide sensitive factor (NSF) attachment protein, putative [Trypanosoma brucei brucei TREU927]XP_011771462.1 soluble N-ethylmaleimide sensitive factor (NSF) attachment protein, putative [Trypanosoma brucei gambiense DAL972]RHW74487.1 soluble N-ethylmaleimide sensitive factor (NSF) attachment protein [Trypanosoma brucei equiperdum]SCU71054.1 soluble N-ethylmaleimide sensitive factor (NSF) attachment protein, putative [Trypanosoma equiperdum]CAJ16522.1 soluble N-ethylmaleimid|eukprot:XP_011771462.1 soluble N-ethylmaleimide sensitive factor (NSF) attachment protein, putative [Trypanosoma brucei gambiense DAL972]
MSAESIYRDAEKKLKKWFFVDYDEAMELFEKAAGRFKAERNYSRAGDAFMKAHDCAMRSKNPVAAGRFCSEAVVMYQKTDRTKAAALLDMAVRTQIDNNKLREAAKLEKDYADAIYEDGHGMEAITHYEKARRYFDAEDYKSQVKNCDVAIANIYGENDMFDKALALFERLGNTSASGPLRHEAKEFYMRAMLCRLASIGEDNREVGSAEAAEALSAYMKRDPYLKNTREAESLQKLLEAVEESNEEKFEDAVSLLQELRMLDEWKTHVLLVVKNKMSSLL